MTLSERSRWEIVLPIALIFLFAGSIFWINFHSAFWYDMDMALNSYLAGLIWNEATFFPSDWIFGNSVFIIESTNLASLFYGLTHQTTLSMSLASSLWVLIIVGTFVWCLKPFVRKNSLAIGTMCLIGGIIFGTSAASYTKGLQVLYTMASYYGCYLEVLLLSIGGWLRLYNKQNLHWTLWGVILLLNFAVGMHSLREMLILGIPLLGLSGLLFLTDKTRRNRNAILLAILILLAEALGYLFIKQLHIPASPNIGGIQTEWSIDLLLANFINSSKNLLRISGIAFIKDGASYLPLFLCALCVCGCCFWSLIDILRKKETSPLSLFIIFAWLSILAVFGVGIFFFRTRDIYFFIYWLLATLSIVYLTTNKGGKKQIWLTSAVCLVAAINYGYNFLPDFRDYHQYAPQMKETTQWLIEEGYTTLYGDDCAVFAAASQDRIVATPIRLNLDNLNEPLLKVFPYNKDISLYDDEHRRHSFVCISNYYLDQPGGIAEKVISRRMNCIGDYEWGPRRILLYATESDYE